MDWLAQYFVQHSPPVPTEDQLPVMTYLDRSDLRQVLLLLQRTGNIVPASSLPQFAKILDDALAARDQAAFGQHEMMNTLITDGGGQALSYAWQHRRVLHSDA